MEILALGRRFTRYCVLEEGLGPRTIDALALAIQVLAKRTQKTEISEITTAVLREFLYEGRQTHRWSYATYRNYWTYLKKFFDWSVKHGHLDENPIVPIGRPKRDKRLPRRLSLENAQRVLYSSFNYPWRYDFERTRNHAIVACLLYTGLRAQELLNLQLDDLDLEAGTILVRQGKGAKDRYVPVHHKLAYVLRRYLFDRKRLQKTSPYVFTAMRGEKKLSYKTLYKLFKAISSDSKVKVTPHCLRHTFASCAIEEGFALTDLQQIMGHADLTSTMIYVQVTPKKARERLNSLELF